MDGGSGLGQSRARGLTRAILDTFPVVKFGGTTTARDGHDAADDRGDSKDIESLPDSRGPRDSTMEMKDWQVVDAPVDKSRPADGEEPHHVAFHTAAGPDDAAEGDSDLGDRQPRASGSRLSAPIVPSPSPDLQPVASRLPDASRISKDVVPAAIGRETCPICIVDFEEGDDLRLLPCEGKHKFHQECVDPWLLELSSSCPICRQGV
jgi:hypothetical protein